MKKNVVYARGENKNRNLKRSRKPDTTYPLNEEGGKQERNNNLGWVKVNWKKEVTCGGGGSIWEGGDRMAH